MESKQISDLIVALTTVGISLLSVLIIKWGDWIKDKFNQQKGKLFQRNLEIRKEIDQELLMIMEKMEASRCCFYEFSNGEMSIPGLPFNYLRMTYERTDGTVMPIRKELEKVSVNEHIESLSKMNSDEIKDHIYDDGDVEDIRRFYKHHKAKMEIRIKISKKLQDGMIGIWYHQEIRNITPDEMEYLHQKAYDIKQLLNQLKRNH